MVLHIQHCECEHNSCGRIQVRGSAPYSSGIICKRAVCASRGDLHGMRPRVQEPLLHACKQRARTRLVLFFCSVADLCGIDWLVLFLCRLSQDELCNVQVCVCVCVCVHHSSSAHGNALPDRPSSCKQSMMSVSFSAVCSSQLLYWPAVEDFNGCAADQYSHSVCFYEAKSLMQVSVGLLHAVWFARAV